MSTKEKKHTSEPEMTEAITPDLEIAIRERAYSLFEEHGKNDGHDLDDWLQAESEICGTRTMTAKA